MVKAVCIHGHFYQPPRENPGLEAIELQDSAWPFHDWNARIAAECYGPNAAARIHDDEDWIRAIVNNYERISFNFGPTLLSWMEQQAPDLYQAILDADRTSRERFDGHGNAIAQVFHHAIMPLCNDRDKRTQVRWGIRDFQLRFGREPEGMWLAEAAVDTPTLEVLAEHGIAFTVLAPSQASRVRRSTLVNRENPSNRSNRGRWKSIADGSIDPKRPYLCRLPSGRSISLFFYDGPVSREVAFDELLADGHRFAARLVNLFDDNRDPEEGQLVHIATDGETFGHHHRFGEMALASALDAIDSADAYPGVELSNYGLFLERHPPTHEVEIIENSSWSCAHGVERWKSDCGCNGGRGKGWNQAWRAPLRESLDLVRDTLEPLFEAKAAEYLTAPWDARDDYVDVVVRRSDETFATFLERHGKRPLSDDETRIVLRLLEIQRHALTMYTSCGWFFDDLSGIETVQVLSYAARVLRLADNVFAPRLEEKFLDTLSKAHSNIASHGDGRAVFEKFVRPGRVDLESVAAHVAIRSVFDPYDDDTQVHCYHVVREDARTQVSGKASLSVGKVRVTSIVTRDSALFTFAVPHFGQHLLNGGVRTTRPSNQRAHEQDDYETMAADISEAFMRHDVPETVRSIDRRFGTSTYSLRSLFRDEQRAVVDAILKDTVAEVEGAYRRIFDDYGPLMRFLADISIPLPKAFRPAAEFAMNVRLREAIEREPMDVERARSLLDEAQADGVVLDEEELSFALQTRVAALAEQFAADPRDEMLTQLTRCVDLAQTMSFDVHLGPAQVACIELGQTLAEQAQQQGEIRAPDGDWQARFRELAGKLRVRV